MLLIGRRSVVSQKSEVMKQLTVLVFRGTGGVLNETNPHYNEPALVRAGHVGVMGVIQDGIIGFHPTPEVASELGG